MKRKELISIIEQGENLCSEFKLRFSSYEKLAKEIIAFANTRGGVILFGVDDNKNIVGVESEKEITELVTETASRYCVPPVEVEISSIDIYDREIVVADVLESDNKHWETNIRDNLYTAVFCTKEAVKIMLHQP